MNDLYSRAAVFPRLLTGWMTPTQYGDLRNAGAAESAIRWDVQRDRRARPFRRTYLDGRPDLVTLLDRLRALFLVLPAKAAVGHHTAAALHGFGVAYTDKLHVVLPRGTPVPQINGVAAHEAVLPFDPVAVLGLPCAPAARCAVDVASVVRRLDALPVLDASLFSGACSTDDLAEEVARHGRLRGIRQVRELVHLADPRPVCRQESQARLIIYDARLPLPEPQQQVFDEYGNLLYVIDLGYEEERVGLEYDGESHLTRDRIRADRRRHNWLESHGWAIRYLTDYDIYRRPDDLVTTVRAALFARRSRAVPTRAPRPPVRLPPFPSIKGMSS